MYPSYETLFSIYKTVALYFSVLKQFVLDFFESLKTQNLRYVV